LEIAIAFLVLAYFTFAVLAQKSFKKTFLTIFFTSFLAFLDTLYS
jgi:hypothetical protein